MSELKLTTDSVNDDSGAATPLPEQSTPGPDEAARVEAAIEKIKSQIRRLLDQVGRRTACSGCGRTIWFVRTAAGKQAPYTDEALNHFADCPKSDRFRKKSPERTGP